MLSSSIFSRRISNELGNTYVKFIYFEKATKFCEIFPFLLSYVVPVKSKEKISQNFVAFSEYTNFILSYLDSTTYIVTM